ncbi:MAG: hypothetical protein ACYSOF_07895 [Planctomycetota bacterium]|jgi:hypothetical protein
MNNIEPAVKAFVEILEELNVPYAIGGSFASSIYGRVRFTQDADVSVAAFTDQIDRFCESAESIFYVSKEVVQQAHRNASSFNLIHLDSVFKIDVFVVVDDPFKKRVLERRRKVTIKGDSERRYDFVSPEDIILLKLQWYSDGGLVSEKQWNDITDVLKNRQDTLDMDYLRDWAAQLSIQELLDTAIQQAKE